MPFTFSHPAVVLPFGIKHTKYINLTALIIGSMAPDFEYFIHFRPIQIVGHSFYGQLYFNLPIILVLSYIYHYLIKEPIITNLPRPYCNRYYYLAKKDWKINSVFRFIVFCYSALIGTFSHIVWDSFTHETGYFVTKSSSLSMSINILSFDIPVYKMLQHGSTLLGFIVIIIYIIAIQDKKALDYVKIKKLNKIKFWAGVFFINIITIILVLLLLKDFTLGRAVITIINGGFIGAVIMSVIIRIKSIINKECNEDICKK